MPKKSTEKSGRTKRVIIIKKLHEMLVLAALASVGGCSADEPGQGRREMEEACELGVGACINNCNRKELGLTCRRCCRRRGSACTTNGTYDFDSCFN